MALPISFFGARQDFFALGIKMPFRFEVVSVIAKYGSVMIAMPYVRHACRAFWNKHALIPVVFCCLVRQSTFGGRSPSKHFFDDGAHVGKLWGVCECRETCTADHSIKLGLRFGEGNHRECPPDHHLNMPDVVSKPAPLRCVVIIIFLA